MPVYQYACTACDEQLEVRQSFTDDALTTCPACEGRLRKVLNAVGVVFKGSGFYRTDSRSESRSSSSSGTESGTPSTPAPKAGKDGSSSSEGSSSAPKDGSSSAPKDGSSSSSSDGSTASAKAKAKERAA